MDTIQIVRERFIEPILNGGFECYLFGGAVRDSINYQTPSNYDIVTTASYDDIKQLFRYYTEPKNNRLNQKYHHINYEYCGIQISIYSTCDIIEFAKQIHFTCNALFEDIHGNLTSFTNPAHIDDCKNKVIRFMDFDMYANEKNPNVIAYLNARFMYLVSKGYTSTYTLEELSKFSRKDVKYQWTRSIKSIFENLSRETYEIMTALGISDCIGLKPIIDSMSSCNLCDNWAYGGNVMEYTWQRVDIIRNMYDHDFIDMLAALLNDCGKPVRVKNTKVSKNNVKYTYNYAYKSIPIITKFLRGISLSKKHIETVCNIVMHNELVRRLPNMKSNYMRLKLYNNSMFDRILKIALADEAVAIKNIPTYDTGNNSLQNFIKTDEFNNNRYNKIPKGIITFSDLKFIKNKTLKNKMINLSLEWQVNYNYNKGKLLNNVKNWVSAYYSNKKFKQNA